MLLFFCKTLNFFSLLPTTPTKYFILCLTWYVTEINFNWSVYIYYFVIHIQFATSFRQRIKRKCRQLSHFMFRMIYYHHYYYYQPEDGDVQSTKTGKMSSFIVFIVHLPTVVINCFLRHSIERHVNMHSRTKFCECLGHWSVYMRFKWHQLIQVLKQVFWAPVEPDPCPSAQWFPGPSPPSDGTRGPEGLCAGLWVD